MHPSQRKIGYLVNQYPQPSQSFIRREIAALEAHGLTVARFTVRRWDGELVDPADQAEAECSRVLLSARVMRVLGAVLTSALRRPVRFVQAFRLAVSVGWRSLRGVGYHLVYLVEACILLHETRRTDVTHLHAHFGTNSTTVAMLCAALGGPSYSFTAHGPEEFDMPISLRLDEKIRRAAFVVSISAFGRSQLCRWVEHGQWQKIHVVRCGLDGQFLRHRSRPIPAAPRLVNVGRLAEQKAQSVLLHAAAQLREQGVAFTLTLAGDGPMRSQLEELIAQLRLSDVVTITGWISGAEVRERLCGARALVLPSFAEGLPVAIMESLALERPVISTYVAGIPELVEPGVCGWLVPAGAVEPLAQAMHEAITAAPEVLQRMGRAGAERVAAQHDALSEAGKLARLFEQPPVEPQATAAREARMAKAPSPQASVEH